MILLSSVKSTERQRWSTLGFYGKCQSGSTVPGSEHRAHKRTSGPQATLMKFVFDCLDRDIHFTGLLEGRASCLLSSGKGNHMLAVIIQITGNPRRCYITSPVYAYVLRAIKRYVHRSLCTSFLLSSFEICGNPGISSLAGNIRYETVTGKCELRPCSYTRIHISDLTV